MLDLFLLENKDIQDFTPLEGVKLVREILYGEARRIGVPSNHITIPDTQPAITTSDGGIDAHIKDHKLLENSSFLAKGNLGLQIKTGKLEIWQKGKIQAELFGKQDGKPKTVDISNLGDRIKEVLNSGGTYIFVSFNKEMLGPNKKDDTEKYIKEFLEEVEITDPKVEVWTLQHLIHEANNFPSIALKIKHRGNLQILNFRSHESWSLDELMKYTFVPGENQVNQINDLQELLRSERTEMLHIHIQGEAGVGKTRIMLEAMKSNDLKSSVIYSDDPKKFIEQFLPIFQLRDNSFSGILIIDECNQSDRITIVDRLKSLKQRITLVTIYNEFTGQSSFDTIFITIEHLKRDHIIEILKIYNIDDQYSYQLAEYCEGYPRIAHLIGINYAHGFSDLLLDERNFWRRILAYKDDLNSQIVENRIKVMEILALFKRFTYARTQEYKDEFDGLINFIQKEHSDLSKADINKIIQHYKDLKLLQGSFTLYMSPKALHIWLWVQWWKTHSTSFDFDFLAETLSNKQLEWIAEMFAYSYQSDLATNVINELIEDGGALSGDAVLITEVGRKFFRAISEAHPKIAIKHLKNVLSSIELEHYDKITHQRRGIIFSLELIGQYEETFFDTVEILWKLAIKENESWANNATGVFADFFSPGYGKVAPTQVPLNDRLDYLEIKIKEDNGFSKNPILKALDNSLETRSIVRTIGLHRLSMKTEPKMWTPKSWEELHDCYLKSWRILINNIESLGETDRKHAQEIILSRTRGLVIILNISNSILDDIESLSLKYPEMQLNIVEVLLNILEYEKSVINKRRELKNRIEEIYSKIIGEDFESILKRYVGTYIIADEHPKDTSNSTLAKNSWDKIVEEMIGDVSKITSCLPWLLTNEAKKSRNLGYSLGINDSEFKISNVIIDSFGEMEIQPENIDLIVGYLEGMRVNDRDRWEDSLIQILDKSHFENLHYLIFTYGLTKKILVKLYSLIDNNDLDYSVFQLVRSIDNDLNNTEVQQFIIRLFSSKDIAIALRSIDVIHTLRNKKYKLGVRLFKKFIVLIAGINEKLGGNYNMQLYGYRFFDVVNYFIENSDKANEDIFELCLSSLSKEGIFDIHKDEYRKLLDFLVRKDPIYAWSIITNYYHRPITEKVFDLHTWLHGRIGYRITGEITGINNFPFEILNNWIQEDIDERAWFMAWTVPNSLYNEDGSSGLAMILLESYGHIKEVRNELHSNFFTTGWSGPASEYYENRISFFSGVLDKISNIIVKKWLTEHIDLLEEKVENAVLREERDGF